MRITPSALTLLLLCSACVSSKTSSVHLAEVAKDVRSFTRSVADNVTQQGPSAWQSYFENTPSFFMAADGRIQFPDGASAQAGIPDLARTIKKIELQWGDGLRIDPLTQELAVVAVPWHETLIFSNGSRQDSSGYFTAVAESRDGRWQFRNAHWSTVSPPGASR